MKPLAHSLTLFATILIATSLPVGAQIEDPEAYGDDYRSGAFGRIRYEVNGATIVRDTSVRASEVDADATLNAPVFPGDTIRTDRDQRLEIELAGGTLVRIDRGTEVTFQALPDPYAEYRDNTIVSLARGAVQIASVIGEDDEFRIDTPSASVYLLNDGNARVEVDDRGVTRVTSRRGVVEVVGRGGSVLVRGGMTTTVGPGSVPDDPVSFSAFAADPFDLWCDERDAVYRASQHHEEDPEVGYDDLPYEVQPYYRELSLHGRWVWVPSYGYCWYPTDVGPGWKPYYDGYWSYGPHGYFWVSSEPWGWAPYHYGRWNWVSGYGWCWAPGRVFAGAWVAWSWGSIHVGWAPLDYWGGPAYYGSVYYGYYDPHCWTFVHHHHLHYHGGYGHHAVPVDRVAVRDHVVTTSTPRVHPRQIAESGESRRRALREVGEQQGARMQTIRQDRRPEANESMRDVDRRLLAGDVRRRGARAGTRETGPEDPPTRVPSRPGRPAAANPSPTVGGTRGPASLSGGSDTGSRAAEPRYPRSIMTDPRSSRETSDRVRTMYRRLSEPRTTRRPTAQQAPSATPAPRAQTPRAQTPRAQTPRARQAPAPRRQTPRAEPKAKPKPQSRQTPQARRTPTSRSAPAPRARQQAPAKRSAPQTRQAPAQRSAPRAKPSNPAPRTSPSRKSSSSQSGNSGRGKKGRK